MKNRRLAIALIPLSLWLNEAYADCAVVGATPGGGEEVECTDNDPDGYLGTNNGDEVTVFVGATVSGGAQHGIHGSDGNDTITMNGGEVTSTDGDGLKGGNGNDDFFVNAGIVYSSTEDGIDGDSGSDRFFIHGGTIESDSTDNQAINGGSESDELTMTAGSILSDQKGITGVELVTVSGGAITSINDDAIADASLVQITGGAVVANLTDAIGTTAGDDTVFVAGAQVSALAPGSAAVDLGDGNDSMELGSGAEITGVLDGEGGTDELVFSMEVDASDLSAVQAAIASANPAGDTLFINGYAYEFLNFEILTDNVSAEATPMPPPPGPAPVNSGVPIPTLSTPFLVLLSILTGLTAWIGIRRNW